MPKKKSHSQFANLIGDMLEQIAPDLCSFDDVPAFSEEFAALCHKYRKNNGFYCGPQPGGIYHGCSGAYLGRKKGTKK